MRTRAKYLKSKEGKDIFKYLNNKGEKIYLKIPSSIGLRVGKTIKLI